MREWMQGIFGIYLGLAVYQDIRRKSVPFVLFLVFGILGGVMRFGMLCREWTGIGEVLSGLLLGVMLLGLSHLSGQALGEGDGWFFLVSACYLSAWENVTLFLGGLFLCAIACLFLVVWGRFHGICMRKRRVAFLPFLLPVWFVMIVENLRRV